MNEWADCMNVMGLEMPLQRVDRELIFLCFDVLGMVGWL